MRLSSIIEAAQEILPFSSRHTVHDNEQLAVMIYQGSQIAAPHEIAFQQAISDDSEWVRAEIARMQYVNDAKRELYMRIIEQRERDGKYD